MNLEQIDILEIALHYGWLVIVPVLEYLFPAQRQPMIRGGLISDILYVFQPLKLHQLLLPFLIAWAATDNGQTAPLQGLLANQSLWVTLLGVALLSEGTFYFTHILAHKIPFFWQFHRVHHSSTVLDSFSTHRFHLLDSALFLTPYLFAIYYFQPNPEFVYIFSIFQIYWDRYCHSNVMGPRFTGYILNTPHFHRWHHSTIPDAIDTNFSRNLVFLDFIFRTAYYPKDVIPHSFGEPGYSNNIIVQQFIPFKTIYEKYKASGFRSLFMPAKGVANAPETQVGEQVNT